MYDAFVFDEDLAERAGSIVNKPYMVDTTERPDIFQILDLEVSGLVMLYDLGLLAEEADFEIRRVENGDVLWPNSEKKLSEVIRCIQLGLI